MFSASELCSVLIYKVLKIHVSHFLSLFQQNYDSLAAAYKQIGLSFNKSKTELFASPFFKKDVKILEDVQRRATKMVSRLHELPYPTRLCKLKLPTLVYRRRWGDAILVHKLINSKALPLASQDSCIRGHNLKLSRHFSSKLEHAHFLTNCVANLWNKLLPDTIAAQTTDSFKNHLDNKWSKKE